MVVWTSGEPVTLTLAGPNDTRTLYSGRNQAFFVSGLADGEYVLTIDGAARSDDLPLLVQHQSLVRAFWLLLLGAVVTLATVAAIVRGARDG